MSKQAFRNQRGVTDDQGTRAAKDIDINSFYDMKDGKGKFAKRKPMRGR